MYRRFQDHSFRTSILPEGGSSIAASLSELQTLRTVGTEKSHEIVASEMHEGRMHE
jgi:hypothetical protein